MRREKQSPATGLSRPGRGVFPKHLNRKTKPSHRRRRHGPWGKKFKREKSKCASQE